MTGQQQGGESWRQPVRRFDTIFQNINIFETTINFPNIPSNQSLFIDVPTGVGQAPLGTLIIAYAPITTATTMDDLVVQFMVVATDTVRVTMFNPTAGGIDPDPIDFQFVTAQLNPDLVEVI
jgi:hypothetical protein